MNHFLELQYDTNDDVWVMIHSGSRNLGKQVADHYIALANLGNERSGFLVPPSWDLAYFDLDIDIGGFGRAYLREMKFCLEFALANRQAMMDRVGEVLSSLTGFTGFTEVVNKNHNDACLEEHFGEQVWVHRKGATPARKGEKGIIPGSQGTMSYIVEGLGNPDSFMSCSHGAGRKMSRAQAKKRLDLDAEISMMDDQDIVHGIRNTGDLDEAPSAYKDISEVIANEADLVTPIVELRPLAVLKGDGGRNRKDKGDRS